MTRTWEIIHFMLFPPIVSVIFHPNIYDPTLKYLLGKTCFHSYFYQGFFFFFFCLSLLFTPQLSNISSSFWSTHFVQKKSRRIFFWDVSHVHCFPLLHVIDAFIIFLLDGWASPVAQLVKNLPTIQETLVQFLHREDLLEKGQATHSSILGLPWWLSW